MFVQQYTIEKRMSPMLQNDMMNPDFFQNPRLSLSLTFIEALPSLSLHHSLSLPSSSSLVFTDKINSPDLV